MLDDRPKKAVVIGLDAPIVPTLMRLAEAGHLPRLKALIDGGTFAERCLVPFPTITPPNWTTIATGATPGTHGITCFNLHDPGTPLDDMYMAFSSRDCRAEFLWDALARAGKTTIVLNYPVSWPPTTDKAIVMGGGGLGMNDWGEGGGYYTHATVAGDLLFTTEGYPEATEIALQPAAGWVGAETSPADLEAVLPVTGRWVSARLGSIEPQTWHLLVKSSPPGDHDRVIVAPGKDATAAFASLKVGEWSRNCYADVATPQGTRRAVFRFKLVELSPDGRRLRLYLTPLCQVDGWASPPEVASEIDSPGGLPLPVQFFDACAFGWIDMETFVELCELQNQWYADAATQTMRARPWDAFFMHAHGTDLFYHLVMDPVAKQPYSLDGPEGPRLEALERRLYESLDRMIGAIVDAAGPEAMVAIVSDHGAEPVSARVDLRQALVDAGLTVLVEDPVTGEPVVDWTRSKAALQRSVYVYVNLKGRDPQGIVEPGEEYERVREQVIRALYSCTGPDGRNPVALALRKEDALVLGLAGDRVGDVVYALREGFGAIHGPQLPTAAHGRGDLRGLLILAGPGIKKGCRLQRTAHLEDVVPTICFLTGFPLPRQAEGAVLYQALEGPDGAAAALARLQEKYQRLEAAYQHRRGLTHGYNA